MGLMPEAMVLADHEASWASHLVWGVLLIWLSPVILLVMAIGLVGMAASGSVYRGATLAPGRSTSLHPTLAEPMSHTA